jgi:hypothetical protein
MHGRLLVLQFIEFDMQKTWALAAAAQHKSVFGGRPAFAPASRLPALPVSDSSKPQWAEQAA